MIEQCFGRATEHNFASPVSPLDRHPPMHTPPDSSASNAILPALSVVVPVYGNEGSIPALLERLAGISAHVVGELEVVFVVDGSPDGSHRLLRQLLPSQSFGSRLVAHSRNFGSFAAIRTGMERAAGEHIAVMAADLQEPPELVQGFQERLLAGDVDLVVGTRRRRARSDRGSRTSRIFWALYRRFIQPDVPAGGVDMFACTSRFRDAIVELRESHSSLVGLAFWLGFERAEIPYDRVERAHGKSGWTLRKKFSYLSDSVFSFTDLPVRILLVTGTLGVLACVLLGSVVAVARMTGAINVPGYAAVILTITFFSALNLCGLGIIGAYVWRAYENTKQRPGAIVMGDVSFDGRAVAQDPDQLSRA